MENSSYTTKKSGTKADWLFVLAMCLVAIGLFVAVFAHDSLTLDEAQSMWQASRSIPGIMSIIAQDVHVPVYHLLLNGWMSLFGHDVVAARSLSLIFFLASIVGLYLLGRKFIGREAALFASGIFTISPFMNWFGTKVRMYSVFTLIVIANQYAFLSLVRARDKASWRMWAAFSITAVLGMYTHYLFALVLFTQGIYALVYWKDIAWNKSRLMVSLLAILGSFVPWAAYVASLGFASNTRPHILEPGVTDVFNTFSNFLFGFQGDRLNSLILALWPLSVLLVFLALQKGRRITPFVLYGSFAVTVPIVTAFLVSVSFRPIYLTRYMIMVLPSFLLLAGWLFSTYPPKLKSAVKSVFVAMVAFTLVLQSADARSPIKENYREAARHLSENAGVRDVVVLSAPFTVYPVGYYYEGGASIRTLPAWNRFEIGPIPEFSTTTLEAEVADYEEKYHKAWLVLSYDQGYEESVKAYFDARYPLVYAKTYSPGLSVYAYEMRPEGPGLAADLQAIRRGTRTPNTVLAREDAPVVPAPRPKQPAPSPRPSPDESNAPQPEPIEQTAPAPQPEPVLEPVAPVVVEGERPEAAPQTEPAAETATPDEASAQRQTPPPAEREEASESRGDESRRPSMVPIVQAVMTSI